MKCQQNKIVSSNSTVNTDLSRLISSRFSYCKYDVLLLIKMMWYKFLKKTLCDNNYCIQPLHNEHIIVFCNIPTHTCL